MKEHCHSIAVRRANGDQLTVREIWGEPRLFGLIADYRVELSTGEAVEPIDENTFMIVATGERLTRMKYRTQAG